MKEIPDRSFTLETEEEEAVYERSIERDQSTPCAQCGLARPRFDRETGVDPPDPCLGYIPGVVFACCGHGDHRYAYVIFRPVPGDPKRSLCFRGHDALDFFALVQHRNEDA